MEPLELVPLKKWLYKAHLEIRGKCINQKCALVCKNRNAIKDDKTHFLSKAGGKFFVIAGD